MENTSAPPSVDWWERQIDELLQQIKRLHKAGPLPPDTFDFDPDQWATLTVGNTVLQCDWTLEPTRAEVFVQWFTDGNLDKAREDTFVDSVGRIQAFIQRVEDEFAGRRPPTAGTTPPLPPLLTVVMVFLQFIQDLVNSKGDTNLLEHLVAAPVNSESYSPEVVPKAVELGCGGFGCAVQLRKSDLLCPKYPVLCREWDLIEQYVGVPLVLKLFVGNRRGDRPEDLVTQEVNLAAQVRTRLGFNGGTFLMNLPTGDAVSLWLPFGDVVQAAFRQWLQKYFVSWPRPRPGETPQLPAHWNLTGQRPEALARSLRKANYVVQPYGGSTLSDLLHRPPAPELVTRAVRTLFGVAVALKVVNDKDIIHGDVKPPNITSYRQDGTPGTAPTYTFGIIDWGIAEVCKVGHMVPKELFFTAGVEYNSYIYWFPENYLWSTDQRWVPADVLPRRLEGLRTLLPTTAPVVAEEYVDRVIESFVTWHRTEDRFNAVRQGLTAASADVWGWGVTLWSVYWNLVWPLHPDTWAALVPVFDAAFAVDPADRHWDAVEQAWNAAMAATQLDK